MLLRRELAKIYLPQLDFDTLEEVVKRVNRESISLELQDRTTEINIEDEDIDEIDSKK